MLTYLYQCLSFLPLNSVQVQTDDKRPRTTGVVITRPGQLGSVMQLNQNNKQRKPVQDEQFESTTKLVMTLFISKSWEGTIPK